MDRLTVLLWICGAVAACAVTDAQGCATPPVIFAPGIVSTDAPEFATTFSPDGTVVYFNRASADRSSFPIYRSVRGSSGHWSTPERLGFSTARDPDPFVTTDGRRLFFCSPRPRPGSSARDFDVWFVERKGAAWGEPVNVGAPVNGPSQEVFVSVAGNGTLYFNSDRTGRSDIHRARPSGAGYAEPELLSAAINGDGGQSNPLIAPDESWLIFASARPGGLGGTDLYVSFNENGKWSVARNLGEAVNSSAADFAPGLGGSKLYFTSERPGIVANTPAGARPPGDIYEVELAPVLERARAPRQVF